jgi:hypothetical protein
VIRVEHLNLTGAGNGKSLGRCLVRFDLTHDLESFRCFDYCLVRLISKKTVIWCSASEER